MGPNGCGARLANLFLQPPLFSVFLSVSGSAVPRPKPEMTHHRSAVFAQPRHQNIQIVIGLGTFLRQGDDLAICGVMNGFGFFPPTDFTMFSMFLKYTGFLCDEFFYFLALFDNFFLEQEFVLSATPIFPRTAFRVSVFLFLFRSPAPKE